MADRGRGSRVRATLSITIDTFPNDTHKRHDT